MILRHLEGCPEPPDRIESYFLDVPGGGDAQVTRCIQCGSQVVDKSAVPGRLEPGSEAWLHAWEFAPYLIVNQLTAAERGDPALNPKHPFASSTMRKATKADAAGRGS